MNRKSARRLIDLIHESNSGLKPKVNDYDENVTINKLKDVSKNNEENIKSATVFGSTNKHK